MTDDIRLDAQYYVWTNSSPFSFLTGVNDTMTQSFCKVIVITLFRFISSAGRGFQLGQRGFLNQVSFYNCCINHIEEIITAGRVHCIVKHKMSVSLTGHINSLWQGLAFWIFNNIYYFISICWVDYMKKPTKAVSLQIPLFTNETQ